MRIVFVSCRHSLQAKFAHVGVIQCQEGSDLPTLVSTVPRGGIEPPTPVASAVYYETLAKGVPFQAKYWFSRLIAFHSVNRTVR